MINPQLLQTILQMAQPKPTATLGYQGYQQPEPVSFPMGQFGGQQPIIRGPMAQPQETRYGSPQMSSALENAATASANATAPRPTVTMPKRKVATRKPTQLELILAALLEGGAAALDRGGYQPGRASGGLLGTIQNLNAQQQAEYDTDFANEQNAYQMAMAESQAQQKMLDDERKYARERLSETEQRDFDMRKQEASLATQREIAGTRAEGDYNKARLQSLNRTLDTVMKQVQKGDPVAAQVAREIINGLSGIDKGELLAMNPDLASIIGKREAERNLTEQRTAALAAEMVRKDRLADADILVKESVAKLNGTKDWKLVQDVEVARQRLGQDLKKHNDKLAIQLRKLEQGGSVDPQIVSDNQKAIMEVEKQIAQTSMYRNRATDPKAVDALGASIEVLTERRKRLIAVQAELDKAGNAPIMSNTPAFRIQSPPGTWNPSLRPMPTPRRN